MAEKNSVWRFRLCRRLINDAAYIRNKPHVEHSVGFVDHETFDLTEVDVATIEKVDQTTGSRDQYVYRTFGELGPLAIEVHAANDANRPHIHVFGESFRVTFNLQG